MTKVNQIAMTKVNKIRLVILYAEVVGYVVGMIEALIKAVPTIEIDVVFWDKRHVNSSRYNFESGHDAFFLHPRSLFDHGALVELLHDRQPDIILVSGWMDKGYLRAIREHKIRGGKGIVVCGIDDQWHGTLRQQFGRVYFKVFYKNLFDFMWVSGKPQYHYAQRFGYENERIISNLYSADKEVFSKRAKVCKRFVFVGRFDPVKAIDQLLEAYLSLPMDVQKHWPLVLIGDGELRDEVERRKTENVIVKPFMQPKQLRAELTKGGVACITSHREQWGVAIHEMAILGFPFVLSSACGAATEFLITGYNGFLFRRSNTTSLRNALIKIASLSEDDLELFSERSHMLGQRITLEHTAYSLLSVIPLSEI